MAHKLTIRPRTEPAVTVTRRAVWHDKLVYIAVANKPIQYWHGSSPIVYIGTTKLGVHRIASSAASLARDMFDVVHGVWKLDLYVVTCKPQKHVKTWLKLERGLILAFRDRFGSPPKCNRQGAEMAWGDEREYFAEQRLRTVIDIYTHL